MGVPGEVPQEIGRAYVQVLVGCLERSVKWFRRACDVSTAPDKLAFDAPSGASYSFDVLGWYNHPLYAREVLLECKGHKDGSKVFEGYKEFLAKSYVTSVNYRRHTRDLFWFVTNVAFGCSIGRKITSREFVYSVLTKDRNEQVSSILGSSHVEDDFVRDLSNRLSICIFPDSFIRRMGVEYLVKNGENVWSIIKSIHAGKVPVPRFEPVAQQVANLNNLQSADRIVAGRRLHVPWYGIEWDD
jgi:hypothetical protein